ncbi:MAG TPA: nodulation protein NfeD [Candidatus Acidoferrales bacterium]|nr:nodulation protein NfeD [Candidatus Acidoferrales bacterium]
MLFQILRRYAVIFVSLAALSLTLIPPAGSAPGPAYSSSVVELRIDGEIEPVLAEYIVRGINEANTGQASLILITMNTPGGLDTSMREIIQAILASKVPVCAYVAPTGSRAASAGFFILLSADIAAMAPGTDTGAASPILVFGGQPAQIDETLHKKIVNEATAYLRSYVTQRGRNAELAASAVTDAKAFSEKEALDGKLVDLIALNREDLLAKLNGRTITRLDGAKLTLALSQPVVVPHEMTAREKFLTRIVQPDVFFILLIVGVLGLYIEFSHPGMFAPGVIGGIALVLALFAMHMLPVNFTGLLLIIVAFVFFVLEAKFPTHGVLGVGGVVAMVLGALILIRSPFTGMGVSLSTALGVALPFAVIIVILMRLVLRSRHWKQSTGKEELVGEEADVTETVGADSGAGMVFVHGELWRATAPAGISIPKGARVRVRKVKGLTLEVEPAHAPHPLHSHETLEGRQ